MTTGGDMNLLEAVNKIITRLGENPVDHVDVRHPTISIVLQHLHSVNTELQIPGWWFNEHRVELQPDFNKVIRVPEDTTTILVDGEYAHLEGRTLVNSRTLSKEWDRSVKGSIKRVVPFEDTPRVFAEWVVDTASVRAYVADYGVAEDIQLWQAEAAMKGQLVQKEHLIQRRVSARNTRRWHRFYQAKWK